MMRGRGGRGRGGRFAPGQRPVSEGQRISISDQLALFQASDETGKYIVVGIISVVRCESIDIMQRDAEYSFDMGLNNHDRAIVHAECRKYGFSSKSFG